MSSPNMLSILPLPLLPNSPTGSPGINLSVDLPPLSPPSPSATTLIPHLFPVLNLSSITQTSHSFSTKSITPCHPMITRSKQAALQPQTFNITTLSHLDLDPVTVPQALSDPR